jgi:hypothetical protein
VFALIIFIIARFSAAHCIYSLGISEIKTFLPYFGISTIEFASYHEDLKRKEVVCIYQMTTRGMPCVRFVTFKHGVSCLPD